MPEIVDLPGVRHSMLRPAVRRVEGGIGSCGIRAS